MDEAQIKQIIKRELPAIMREDAEIQQLVLQLAHDQFAGKAETESRFDRLLAELRQDREAQQKKWEAHEKEWQIYWEAQEKKWETHEKEWKAYWEAQEKKWEAQEKKWAENQETLRQERAEQKERWAEQDRKWAENQEALRQERAEQKERWEMQERKWAENQEAFRQERAEQDRKWAENQEVINRLLKRLDSSIGALGARWGIRSEQSFRNALKSILEESFDVEVLNIVEFDDEGTVFGQPDQVEIDIIIKNGLLIICEIKSSMSRSDMYTFGRKISFYEKRHNQTATRKLVISPWVEAHARRVAKKLGIEVYTHADDIEQL